MITLFKGETMNEKIATILCDEISTRPLGEV